MQLVLPEDCTIARAAELKARLVEALRSDEPVDLDARAVVEVDVAGLQLLWSALRTARARGRSWTLAPDRRSAALERAVELAGLSPEGPASVREG